MDSAARLSDDFHQLSAIARRHVRDTPVGTYDNKLAGGFDPVTELDRAIERSMRAYLALARPDHGVWGEEEGWSGEGAQDHWSLDPVDGTRALICGLPSWCVLAGFLSGGAHVAGMIDCPALDEMVLAVDGRTRRNGVRVTSSRCATLADARLATTDPFLFDDEEGARFAAVRERCMVTRYGLDALAYARVATGGIDLVVESRLKRHDLDALVAVVRGAGGAVGDWNGGEDWDGGRIVAAASPALYDEAVAILSR